MFSIMIAYLKMFTEYSYIFLISYLGNDNGHTYLSTLYYCIYSVLKYVCPLSLPKYEIKNMYEYSVNIFKYAIMILNMHKCAFQNVCK